MKSLNKFWFVALLGFLLTLAYGHTFKFPFQFDDYNVIVNEPKVHSLGAWWQSMPGMRSLLKLSYALNWRLEAAPRFFRLFNLACHFYTSILVWRFSRDLLPYLLKNTQNINVIAMLAALMFALHPAHSEVVTYISSRSTGLMTFLCMSSLCCWLHYLKNSQKAYGYLLVSILCCLLAVLVKEPALVLPVLAYLVARCAKPELSFSRAQKITLLAVFFALIAYIALTPQYLKLMSQTFTLSTFKSQLATQPLAHWHYLTQTLRGSNLSVDYTLELVQTFSAKSLAIIALVSTLVGLSLLYFRRFPLASFCVLWWFICLIPSNSIIPRLDIVNDRQIYFASVGVLLLAATGIVQLATYLTVKNMTLRLIAYALTAAWIMALLVATWLRNWDYESEVSLWHSSLKQQPNNARAWNNLGYAYMLRKENEKAIHAFENALELDQENHKAYYNLQQLRETQEK